MTRNYRPSKPFKWGRYLKLNPRVISGHFGSFLTKTSGTIGEKSILSQFLVNRCRDGCVGHENDPINLPFGLKYIKKYKTISQNAQIW